MTYLWSKKKVKERKRNESCEKYVAKLREYKTSAHPLIFDCNMDAGHGGGSGRSNERLEVAKVYAFILGLEGILK